MSIIEFIFKDLIVNIVGKTSLSTQLSDVFISRIDHIQGACEDDIKDQIAFKSSSLDNCVVKRCRASNSLYCTRNLGPELSPSV